MLVLTLLAALAAAVVLIATSGREASAVSQAELDIESGKLTPADSQTPMQLTVRFALDSSDVGFYDDSGRFVVEPGTIDVYAGNSSSGEPKGSFTLVR